MMHIGVIEPSDSAWSSPVVLVAQEGRAGRFCVDFRRVNVVTKGDAFPLPRLEDCIDQVGQKRFVTKIDLLKGYFQVPLTERAKEVSAFADFPTPRTCTQDLGDVWVLSPFCP